MAGRGERAAVQKMDRAGVSKEAVRSFRHYYRQLVSGETGLIGEESIEPVGCLPKESDLDVDRTRGEHELARTVEIKLNGGLATSMGLHKAKSLLTVKDGLSFLDIIVRQVLALRKAHDVSVPLVLMNSFRTQRDSLAVLERCPEIRSDVPFDFVQNRFPKLRASDLMPVSHAADPELEWAPPGHGDLYTVLFASGMLKLLRERGYRYAFVSNSDNLGAVIDPVILAWMAEEEIPFVMEVAGRTEADRKGGHVARLKSNGRLILREIAQTPLADHGAFEDTDRHRYFNTNTIWLDLRQLETVLSSRDGVMGLPMIKNLKRVDPADPASTEVVQIETAMGAAISEFDGAQALVVDRSRFAPVKTTNELLGLRSDSYVLTDDYRVCVAPERTAGALFVDLDTRFFKLLSDFDARFPDGVPSLVECERFVVEGDFLFRRGVVAEGSVELRNESSGQVEVPAGTRLFESSPKKMVQWGA